MAEADEKDEIAALQDLFGSSSLRDSTVTASKTRKKQEEEEQRREALAALLDKPATALITKSAFTELFAATAKPPAPCSLANATVTATSPVRPPPPPIATAVSAAVTGQECVEISQDCSSRQPPAKDDIFPGIERAKPLISWFQI